VDGEDAGGEQGEVALLAGKGTRPQRHQHGQGDEEHRHQRRDGQRVEEEAVWRAALKLIRVRRAHDAGDDPGDAEERGDVSRQEAEDGEEAVSPRLSWVSRSSQGERKVVSGWWLGLVNQ
jgi:hypothetical protein